MQQSDDDDDIILAKVFFYSATLIDRCVEQFLCRLRLKKKICLLNVCYKLHVELQ